MIESRKMVIEQIELDEDLENYTVPQLKRLAEAHGVFFLSSYRKDDLVKAIRTEQSVRRRRS